MRLDYYYQRVNMWVVSRVRIAEQLETQDIRNFGNFKKILTDYYYYSYSWVLSWLPDNHSSNISQINLFCLVLGIFLRCFEQDCIYTYLQHIYYIFRQTVLLMTVPQRFKVKISFRNQKHWNHYWLKQTQNTQAKRSK